MWQTRGRQLLSNMKLVVVRFGGKKLHKLPFTALGLGFALAASPHVTKATMNRRDRVYSPSDLYLKQASVLAMNCTDTKLVVWKLVCFAMTEYRVKTTLQTSVVLTGSLVRN